MTEQSLSSGALIITKVLTSSGPAHKPHRIPKIKVSPQNVTMLCRRLDRTNGVAQEAPRRPRAGLSVDDSGQRELAACKCERAHEPRGEISPVALPSLTTARPRTGESGRPKRSGGTWTEARLSCAAHSLAQTHCQLSGRAVTLSTTCVCGAGLLATGL